MGSVVSRNQLSELELELELVMAVVSVAGIDYR